MRALEIAVSMETAAKDAGELQGKSPSACTVHKFHTKRNNDKTQPCYRCGKKSHDPADCWFKDKDCRLCNKKGHIQKMCQSRQSVKQRKKKGKRDKGVHEVTKTDSNDSNEGDLSCLDLYSTEVDDSEVIWLTPKVNGVPIKMELDTGSVRHILQRLQSTFP